MRSGDAMKKELLPQAYGEMLRIRLIEERLVKEYLERNLRSFVHFYIGQEAVAVGVCMNLTKNDYAFGTHRCHGHYLAKGGDLKAMIAELYGKVTGCSKGRGGSMHLIDQSVGYMGSISILASLTSIATGMAFQQKKYKWKNITVAFVGDGAADEGGFYESINLAALMEAPIIFVLENNLYAGMSDAEARHSKFFDREAIVRGLGAEYYKVDGNDVIEVYDAMFSAKTGIHKTGRPSVIEAMTFRHMAHSAPIMDDDLGYRKVDTLEARLKACPLKRITDKYFFEFDMIDFMKAQINQEIEEALHFAEKSPMPDPADLTEGVYHE